MWREGSGHWYTTSFAEVGSLNCNSERIVSEVSVCLIVLLWEEIALEVRPDTEGGTGFGREFLFTANVC